MTFTVTLKPIANYPGAPAYRRLARFLKAAKRGYGFQCVTLREETSETSEMPYSDLPHTNTAPASETLQARQAVNAGKGLKAKSPRR